MKVIVNILFTLLFSTILSITSWAQPSNDNCGGATFIVPSSNCNSITSTTLNATQTMPGCNGTANDDVWFIFTANSPSLDVVVQGTAGFDAVVEAFPGSCANTSIGCANNTGLGGSEVLSLTGLISGLNYYVRVYHAPATNPTTPTFYICVTQPTVMPPCNTSTPAGNDCAQAVLICEVDGYCGNTSSTYTVNSWPELNSAFCGSIENNSFIRFVAENTMVSLNVWVNSSTGTGIQIMVFSANTCGSGPVTGHFCEHLTFNQSGPPVAQSVLVNGLIPGNTYYMMIDGYAGAVSDYTIGVNSGIQVSGSINTVGSGSTICLGNSVNLQASGGNGVYNWSPNPDLNVLTGPDVVATPTTTGIHTYSVTTNSNNPACPSAPATIDIDVQPIVEPSAGIDDSICLGDSYQLNGTQSSASNTIAWNYNTSGISPTPTVTFSPGPSVLNPTITVNQPGVYKFILRETSNICGIVRDTMLLTVIDPQQNLSFQSPSCFGGNDGEIMVDNQYASEYSFDGGTTWQVDSFAVGFAAGTYTICSRNNIGCEICSDITVDDPVAIDLQVSGDTLICENGTATLIAQATGGTDFDYHWVHQSTDLSGTQLVSPQTPTQYSVYAENEFGCISTSRIISVDLRDPISGTISTAQNICPGDQTSIFAETQEGIGAPYTFTWDNGIIETGISSSIMVNPTVNTNYSVTITDVCESTPLILNTSVNIAPLPDPQFTSDFNGLCESAIFNLQNTTDPNLTDAILWEISDGSSYMNVENVSTNPLSAGSYDVSLTVTSLDGCQTTKLFSDFLTVFPKPEPGFTYSPDPVMMFNTEVNFNNNSTNADTYQWYFESGSPVSSANVDPVVMFPDGETGQYEVMLIATSEYGCTDTIVKDVIVSPEVIFYAPNTFTPDDDEFNQNWRVFIEGIDIYSFELKIYNRWGELIFESLDSEQGWDGTYKGQLLPTGTYNWTIRTRDALNDAKYEFQGHINIIR